MNITQLEARVEKAKATLIQAEKDLAVAYRVTSAGVKHGDYIRCLRSVDWAYNEGDIMWVDEVHDSHLLARSANPKYRKNGIFWVSNSDWVLHEQG